MKKTKLKLELEFDDNMNGDRDTLRAGYNYLVRYRDSRTGETKLAGATWTGTNFKWCEGSFVFPHVEPSFNQIGERHYIIGWLRLPCVIEGK
jgi:hypothetical protein